MNENVKGLRSALVSLLAHKPGTQRDVLQMFDAALAAARDAALEEAKATIAATWESLAEGGAIGTEYGAGLSDLLHASQASIHALKSQPAPEAAAPREVAIVEDGLLPAPKKEPKR